MTQDTMIGGDTKTGRSIMEINEIVRELKKPFDVSKVKSKPKGNMHLHHINARDVMFRLDAVVGPLNWQDSYEEVLGRVICTLKVRIGDEWISTADGAGDTKIEGEKGGISDAFKRAGVKWGIGRYLYYLNGAKELPSWADPASGKWTDELADRI